MHVNLLPFIGQKSNFVHRITNKVQTNKELFKVNMNKKLFKVNMRFLFKVKNNDTRTRLFTCFPLVVIEFLL